VTAPSGPTLNTQQALPGISGQRDRHSVSVVCSGGVLGTDSERARTWLSHPDAETHRIGMAPGGVRRATRDGRRIATGSRRGR
jgi:hypothetical protein